MFEAAKRHGVFFKDRTHAGKELANLLEPKYKHLNPLILGVPRGGVEVAYYVAKQLHAELSVVISKKLPFPGQEEYGFGAVSEDYSVYVAPHGQQALSPERVDQIVEQQVEEIKRRIDKYRGGRPLPDMKGRTVIIVDDGIATGATLVPVIKLCRKKGAERVVIAAPVSGITFDAHLHEADDIEIIVQPEHFFAVGQVYETFGDFPDDQLLDLLKKAREERNETNE